MQPHPKTVPVTRRKERNKIRKNKCRERAERIVNVDWVGRWVYQMGWKIINAMVYDLIISK
jgi:hypothetical protein